MMKTTTVCFIAMTACTGGIDGGSTGDATYSTNGGAAMAVSAWAVPSTSHDDVFLIGPDGPLAYRPWEIQIGSVPVGTSCATGTGQGSLRHDASSWLASIAIWVPYSSGDDKATLGQLATGAIPVATLDSGMPPITTRVVEVQIFDPAIDIDVMSAGTLTIDSFDDAGIIGSFDASGGTGQVTTATATFTANRCDI